MKKMSYILSLFLIICFLSAQEKYELKTKDIMSYIFAVEKIINSDSLEKLALKNDFFIIHEDWYESKKTKGQWYGETLNIWLIKAKERKMLLLDEDMIRVLFAARFADWPNPYAKDNDKLSVRIIYYKIKENRIEFMIRNDVWYYSFGAELKKQKNGKYKIINISNEAYMHS